MVEEDKEVGALPAATTASLTVIIQSSSVPIY
jgi:hypothetical protein